MLLKPVSYNWLRESTTTPTHTGFIAQDVQKIFPDLVQAGDDGKLSLNYAGFTPYLTTGLQEINRRLETIASTTASSTPDSLLFAESFWHNLFTRVVQWLADASNGIGKFFAGEVNTKKLCVSDDSGAETCLTKAQLDSLIANAATGASNGGSSNSGSSAPPPPPPPADSGSDDSGTSTPPTDTATSTDAESPVISISGNNPATVDIGDAYVDLGATVTDNVDHNLGIHSSLDGVEVDAIQLDTSVAGEHTIIYRATDQAGNVGEATRTVHVVDPTPPAPESTPEPSPTEPPATDATSTTP